MPKQAAPNESAIMTKPLPQILDEMVEATIRAEKAAADARAAAEEARLAGERAAESVMKRIRRVFLKMADDITQEMKEGAK